MPISKPSKFLSFSVDVCKGYASLYPQSPHRFRQPHLFITSKYQSRLLSLDGYLIFEIFGFITPARELVEE